MDKVEEGYGDVEHVRVTEEGTVALVHVKDKVRLEKLKGDSLVSRSGNAGPDDGNIFV